VRIGAIPRIAVRWPEEAAVALGVSDDFLRKHGLSAYFRIWRVRSLRLVAIAELERVVSEQASLAAGGPGATG
jgi:hypothetical protein